MMRRYEVKALLSELEEAAELLKYMLAVPNIDAYTMNTNHVSSKYWNAFLNERRGWADAYATYKQGGD